MARCMGRVLGHADVDCWVTPLVAREAGVALALAETVVDYGSLIALALWPFPLTKENSMNVISTSRYRISKAVYDLPLPSAPIGALDALD